MICNTKGTVQQDLMEKGLTAVTINFPLRIFRLGTYFQFCAAPYYSVASNMANIHMC
jgi:hypothetical protein